MTNSPSVQDDLPPQVTNTRPDWFRDSREALRALRKLELPFDDKLRASFAEKVSKSPVAQSIAFAVLGQAWSGITDTRWIAVRSNMRQLLLGNRECPSGRHLADARIRNDWLASEFNTDHRTEVAKAFIARFGYLRPLYILLAEPDNEPWLDNALGSYLDELEYVLSVARGKSGTKKTSVAQKQSSSAKVAALILRQLPAKANAPKALLAHLRMAKALSETQAQRVEQFELLQKQVQTLAGRLEEQNAQLACYESALSDTRNQTSVEQAKVAKLEQELQAAIEQQRLQKGIADAKLQDELNGQRAALRAQLRPKLQNVRLYADRTDPARDKIIRLCDEMTAVLDQTAVSTL